MNQHDIVSFKWESEVDQQALMDPKANISPPKTKVMIQGWNLFR